MSADGYAGFEDLHRSGDIRELARMAHASRCKIKHGAAIKDFLLAQQVHETWPQARQVRNAGEFLALVHKPKIAAGSPLVVLPPADEPEQRHTEDCRFPFGFGASWPVSITPSAAPQRPPWRQVSMPARRA